MATVTYDGLQHTSLGVATLAVNQAGNQLTVGALTSSGSDGVKVDLTGYNSWHVYTDPISVTSTVEFRTVSKGKDSTNNTVVLSDCRYKMEGSDIVITAAGGPLSGATSTLKVYKNGVLQYSGAFPPVEAEDPEDPSWIMVVGIIIAAGTSYKTNTKTVTTTHPDGSKTTTTTTFTEWDWDLNPFGNTVQPSGSGNSYDCDLLVLESVKTVPGEVSFPVLDSVEFTTKGLSQLVLGNETYS